MKKIGIIAVLLLMLIACKEELPPSPPPPGGATSFGRAMAGVAGGMPSWAAPARNIVLSPSQPYYGDGVLVSVSNFEYVYSNGYFFNSQSRTWERFNLQGERTQDWIKGQAVGSITVDKAKFAEGDSYAVIYACLKVGKNWECNGNRWMLVTFKVLGAATGAVPQLANVDQFVINQNIAPFDVVSTLGEKDNFNEVVVNRYDARYRESKGLVVLAHVFDFNSRADVDKTINTLWKDIVINGFKVHMGHNVAVFLDESDHRDAVWTSGRQLIFIETFWAESANKEIIEAYLAKYPSDLPKLT